MEQWSLRDLDHTHTHRWDDTLKRTKWVLSLLLQVQGQLYFAWNSGVLLCFLPYVLRDRAGHAEEHRTLSFCALQLEGHLLETE